MFLKAEARQNLKNHGIPDFPGFEINRGATDRILECRKTQGQRMLFARDRTFTYGIPSVFEGSS